MARASPSSRPQSLAMSRKLKGHSGAKPSGPWGELPVFSGSVHPLSDSDSNAVEKPAQLIWKTPLN